MLKLSPAQALDDCAESTAFSYYNTAAESPGGGQVCWVRYHQMPATAEQAVQGSLWIAQADTLVKRRVADLMIGSHNGANQFWLNDHALVYESEQHIHVIDDNGNPITEAWRGHAGHGGYGQRTPYNIYDAQERRMEVWEFDLETAQHRQILRNKDFAPWQSRFPDDHDPDPADWQVLHLQYSPDGSALAMRVSVGSTPAHQMLFTVDLSTGAPCFFGPKPMHFLWYDSTSIIGHDDQVPGGPPSDRSLRRWDLQGRFLETLAGPGNHLAISPDKRAVLSDSWYRSDPVELRLFAAGVLEPAATLYSHHETDLVWKQTWHSNPSFSHDGQRMYANLARANGTVQAVRWQLL